MACLQCPLVVAADHVKIPAALLEAEPVLRLLCTDHFRDFVVKRDLALARKIREENRMWCACGGEKFLDRPGPCERCRLQIQPTVPVTAGEHPIRIDAEWYSKPGCDAEGCETSPFRLPDGRTVCEAHGAPPKAEKTQDLAGRS